MECPPGTNELSDSMPEIFVGAMPDGHILIHFFLEAARCAREAKLLRGTPPLPFVAVADWMRAAAGAVISRGAGLEVCLFMV